MRVARLAWVCGVVAVLAAGAHAEPLLVFDVNVTFADGHTATGTVSLPDQNALFVSEDLTLRAGATVLATYTGEGELIPFLPPPVPPFAGATTTSIVSEMAGGSPYALSLIVPTGRLAEWAGGAVCLENSGCFNGLYTTATTTEPSGYGGTEYVLEPAVGGSFLREGAASPMPEPASMTLLAMGALAGMGWLRRGLRDEG